jgi:hypothetical protein
LQPISLRIGQKAPSLRDGAVNPALAKSQERSANGLPGVTANRHESGPDDHRSGKSGVGRALHLPNLIGISDTCASP